MKWCVPLYFSQVCMINPDFVNTDMVTGMGKEEMMLRPEDISAAAMFAIRAVSPQCVPQEITLRLTKLPISQELWDNF